MNKFGFSLVLAATVLVAGVQPLQAQAKKDGPGGFLDWLHRLSGPMMVGPAGSYFWAVGEGEDEEEKARIRVSGGLSLPLDSDDKIDPGHSLNMLSIQPSIEIPIGRCLEGSIGLGLHRFGGDGHDPVYHVSVPVMGQFRLPVNDDETLLLRVAVGVRYFPPFDDDAFDGGVRVETDKNEFPVTAQIGLDFKWR